MSDLWYYTRAGKQMEPVTAAELRRLARDGELQRADMVWTQGMARWSRAESIEEIFPPDERATASQFSESQPVRTAAGVPRAGANSSRRRHPEQEDEGEDEKGPERFRERPAFTPTMLVAICAGGGVLLLALILLLVLLLVPWTPRPPAPAAVAVNGRPPPIAYSVILQPNQSDIRTFPFRQNVHYAIRVQTAPGNPAPDVDLEILNMKNKVVMSDPSVGPDAFLVFSPWPGGEYRVRVVNVGAPPIVAASTVTIEEQ